MRVRYFGLGVQNQISEQRLLLLNNPRLWCDNSVFARSLHAIAEKPRFLNRNPVFSSGWTGLDDQVQTNLPACFNDDVSINHGGAMRKRTEAMAMK